MLGACLGLCSGILFYSVPHLLASLWASPLGIARPQDIPSLRLALSCFWMSL